MSETGRFGFRDMASGRRLCVEPLEKRQEERVELQASETVVEDNRKHTGTIKPTESVITEQNGFVDIAEVETPLDSIDRRVRV